MAIDMQNGRIRVYNYSRSHVGFPSIYNKGGVFIRGRSEDEEYVVERVHWDDIESENTKSDIFKVGALRFHPDEEDEIYAKLGIEDRENIMTDEELMNLLRKNDIETIKRISNINSMLLITRMKQMLFEMERAGMTPKNEIIAVVCERYDELTGGKQRNPDGMIARLLNKDEDQKRRDELEKEVKNLANRIYELEKEREQQNKLLKKKDELLNQSQNAIEELLKKVEKLTKEQSKVGSSKGNGRRKEGA
jgi:uncharacterized coiled-coil protein SlyX